MRRFKFLIIPAFSLITTLPLITLSAKVNENEEVKFLTLDSKYNTILNSNPTYKIKNEKIKIAEFTLPNTMLYSFNNSYKLVYESISNKSKNLSYLIPGEISNLKYMSVYPHNNYLNEIDNDKFIDKNNSYWNWLKSIDITNMFADKKSKNANFIEFNTTFNQNAYTNKGKYNIDYSNFSFSDVSASKEIIYDILNSNKVLFYEDYFTNKNNITTLKSSWDSYYDFRKLMFKKQNVDKNISFTYNSAFISSQEKQVKEINKALFNNLEFITLGISKFNNRLEKFNSSSELDDSVLIFLSNYYSKNISETETINLQKSKINDYKISLNFKVVENKVNNNSESEKLVDLNSSGTIYNFTVKNNRDIDLTTNPVFENKILLPVISIYANNAQIIVEDSEKQILKDAYSDFSNSFITASKYLKNNTLSIISNDISKQSLFDNEIQNSLNIKISEINDELIKLGCKFSIEYEIANDNSINVLLSNKNNNLIEKSEYIVKNLPIKITLTEEAITTDINKRLIIQSNKYVDFKTNTTELVDDIPIILTDPYTIDNKTIYGGKFLYHAPAKVKFLTIDEDEVLFINNKRIQVYNKKFEEILEDRRLFENSTEDTDEVNYLNNYHIEIKKYRPNSGNTENNYLYSYIIDLVIDANSLVNTFKYYAWDPTKNKDQEELITEFLKDKDGKFILDEFGNKILNPKYDKEIDIFTGTKKELVWVDLSKNAQILSNLDYYLKTNLPFSTKTLLAKNNNEIVKGFIAEASVLGSGALHTLIGLKNSSTQYRLFKININNLSNDKFAYELIDNNYYKDLAINTSENTYFSSSGIWLFTSHTENSIDNYKLILIDDKLNAQKDKFSNIILSERIKKLWNSSVGMDFYDFLANEFKLSKEKIYSLSYENVLQYFMLFINENHKYNSVNALNSYTYIYPQFRQVPNTYSYQNFINTYTGNSEKMNSFIADYGLNFNYKNQLVVNNLSVSVDKKFVNLIVGLKNNNSTFNYRLAQSVFRVPIQFIDVNYPKENENDNFNSKVPLREIKLNFNIEYINNLVLNTEVDKLVVDNRWFNNLNINDFNKLIFNINYEKIDSNTIKFIVDTQLKEEYKNQYYLTNNTYENIFLAKKVNIGSENIDKEIGIFEDIDFSEFINVNGLEDKEEIKEFIIDTINKKLSKKNLILDIDYKIINIENAINFLSNIHTYNEEDIKFTKIRLEAIKKNGVKDIKFINYVHQIFNKTIDLSNLKFDDVIICEDTDAKIKDRIIEKTKELFNKLNINFDELILINIDELIDKLNGFIKQGTLKIISNNNKLINTAQIRFFNEIKTNTNEITQINLGMLRLRDLTLSETNYHILQQKIINFVRNELAYYGLIYNQDYIIEEINDVTELYKLVIEENKLNTCFFTIKGISNYAINTNQIRVQNYFINMSDEDKQIWKNKLDDFINRKNNSVIENIPDRIDRNKLVDLSKISINDLVLYENNSTSIYNKIISYIDNELTKLNLSSNVYIITQSQINSIIDNLLSRVNEENVSHIILNPNYGYSIKSTMFEIRNTPLKAIEKEEILIKDKDNFIDNTKKEVAQLAKEKNIKIAVISSIAIIVSLVLSIIGGYFLYIRFIKNKIKG